MEITEMIKVMEAFREGEEIEIRYIDTEKWNDSEIPRWNFIDCEYRIKPKEKTKLYKYAYLYHKRWAETELYYKDDSDFDNVVKCDKFIRLNDTMIEVD